MVLKSESLLPLEVKLQIPHGSHICNLMQPKTLATNVPYERTCVCVCVCVCVYVCTYVCMYVVCMCLCMCVYVCMYVCMYVCFFLMLNEHAPLY
jgi:hypothetical protein